MQRERVCMGTNAYRCVRARVIVHRSAESEAPTVVLGTMLSAPLNSTDKQDSGILPLAENFLLRPACTAHNLPYHVLDWSQVHAAMRRRKEQNKFWCAASAHASHARPDARLFKAGNTPRQWHLQNASDATPSTAHAVLDLYPSYLNVRETDFAPGLSWIFAKAQPRKRNLLPKSSVYIIKSFRFRFRTFF
jgi:hypothetical protein